MKKLTHHEIRETWLRFFENKGHKIEASASLIPQNDPTLLWINSGVAALKKYFDGREIPNCRRITNIQRSLRTNDIENVGVTARHHTFFEMMGNFSIGDYFRDEVIPWAFELLTGSEYFAFPLEKLYFTYYPDDIESRDLWLKCGVSESHIIPLAGNFWEIGEGPCGPDTEIFFDRGEKYDKRGIELLENDIENERFVEIWNIVFSQYNAQEGLDRSEYRELPSRNIDTGAGLERFALVLQEAESNYETDLFKPIIDELYSICMKDEKENIKAYRIIADHTRTIVFALSDGAAFSNLGRGYVLRRLLRRAIKYARTLGLNAPFLGRLVDTIVLNMKDFYPYLLEHKEIVKKLVEMEEEQFFLTIAKGEVKLNDIINNKHALSGSDAFMLYDTYGFPLELSTEYCLEANIEIDIAGFHECMAKQKEQSRQSRAVNSSMGTQNELFMQFHLSSKFVGYNELDVRANVIAVFEDGVVLDKTPFYAESGGQIADKGTIDGASVSAVIKMPNKQHLHIVGNHEWQEGDVVRAIVDGKTRKKTQFNHTATHLLHYGLKEVLGEHVKQQGSYVGDRFIRFDFNHFCLPSTDELLAIEEFVNGMIKRDYDVVTDIKPIKDIGNDVVALFDDKYGDLVRVVSIGPSKELCGGTHARKLHEIELFGIISSESIGSGMYRIIATSGSDIKSVYAELSHSYVDEYEATKRREGELLLKLKHIKSEEFLSIEIKSYKDIIKIREATKEHKEVIKHYQKMLEEQVEQDFLATIGRYKTLIEDRKLIIKLDNVSVRLCKLLADTLFENEQLNTVFIVTNADNKASYICKSRYGKANELIKLAAKIANGSGGGRGDFASGGGDVLLTDAVIEAIREAS